MDIRVVRDLLFPLNGLGFVGELSVVEQVGDFEVRGVLGQLFDRVAAIAQDALVAVDEGDGRFRGRGVDESGVVEPDTGHGLGELRGGHATPVDGNLSSFAGAVVGHRN